ncbi:Iron(III) transport system ATP-binding protein OS=Castellaniella defragrans OX=75697 GN=HNR28_000885 PE=4 SV=1 [Castellaniella defragrans]
MAWGDGFDRAGHVTGAKPCKSGSEIHLEGLTKHFRRVGGEQVKAIDAMTLHIAGGQFIVLVGPSGCGKTTLLRCLAGLESPDSGVIRFGDQIVFSSQKGRDEPPEARDAAMLFQSYALWPHMTVFDNVAYPLRTQKVSRDQIEGRVRAVLKKVQCENLRSQYPGQISGGQQQRVALARALVAGNRIVLFDEPLSNIDAKVRDELRLEILEIQRELGFTAIYVTHDQTEAMALADQIVVLKEGKIAQVGTPAEVYEQPASEYVARFMGALNALPGRRVPAQDDSLTYRTALGEITLHGDPSRGGEANVLLGFRPTRCTLYAERSHAPSQENLIAVDVAAEIFLGTHYEYVVRAQGAEYRCWSFGRVLTLAGSAAWLHVPPDGIRILTALDGVGVPQGAE